MKKLIYAISQSVTVFVNGLLHSLMVRFETDLPPGGYNSLRAAGYYNRAGLPVHPEKC